MITKKIFALASVTALTGLIASVAASGCSSTSIEHASDTAETGAGDATVKPTDAMADPADDAAPNNSCKGTLAVDLTMLMWQPPNIATGACSETELSALVTYVDSNANAKYADWKTSVTNAACNSCVFGKEADTKWRPLLEDTKGELAELNVGGCIEVATGKDDCGKAYQNWFDCRFEACSDCASGDTTALKTCLTAASKNACKTALDSVVTVCGDAAISDAETQCTGAKFVFEGPIRAQCIGFTDGG